MSDLLRIAPFAGYRYNPEKIPELFPVIAPPYDMISPSEQEALYGRHPWNIVRLILTREEQDEYADRYRRAAATYERWKLEKVLVRDAEPSIYAYRQDYQWEGKTLQRLGFIARVALCEFGEGAFPHESTLSGPKADRLRLLTACRANFSCIFSLFSDSKGMVLDRLGSETAASPLVRVEDDKGVTHLLWRLARPEFHSWLNEQMRDRQFIIADGHHRYETALEYRRLMRENPAGAKGDYDYVMMFLVPIESPGLSILPFHRVLRGGGRTAIMEKLAAAFEITEFAVHADEKVAAQQVLEALQREPADTAAFGLYLGGSAAYVLRMRADFDRASHFRAGTPPQVQALDVTVLHQLVLGSLLGLDEQQFVQEGRITFHSRPEEAVARVRQGGDETAFFLRATRIEQVWEVALSGHKMPQKSTNFHPKLTTGLVLNEL